MNPQLHSYLTNTTTNYISTDYIYRVTLVIATDNNDIMVSHGSFEISKQKLIYNVTMDSRGSVEISKQQIIYNVTMYSHGSVEISKRRIVLPINE